MNFQCDPIPQVLRVLLINPLAPASKLIATKIMAGAVFGHTQLIDMVFLVYTNEMEAAQELKQELMCCAFSCFNSISITSELPTISDADVFCFVSNLENPNYINFCNESPEQFDSLYLALKIASNLGKQKTTEVQETASKKGVKKNIVEQTKRSKPIIIGDGLVVMDILNTFAKDLPTDILFYCTALPSIARAVISDHLKVIEIQDDDIMVWAANEETFYLRMEDPHKLTMTAKTEFENSSWDSDAVKQKFKVDYMHFNPVWLKKDFLEKVQQSATKNPHGCIYKAAEMSRTLHKIWKVRTEKPGTKLKKSLGVISSGSLGTIKGLPYVLPLIFSGDSWVINDSFEEDSHMKNEIKKMNKFIKKKHDELVAYCRKFQEENVVNLSFIAVDNDSESVCTLLEQSTRSSASERFH